MAGKGNIDNLIKNEDLTPDERRRNAEKAGRASGRARREKKIFRETIEAILAMPMGNGKGSDVEKIRNFAAIKGQNISVQEAIVIAQVQKAMKGDTKAAEYLRDTVGQKPTDNLKVDTGVNIDDAIRNIDEYLKGRGKNEQGIS